MQATDPRRSIDNTFEVLKELQAHLNGEENAACPSIQSLNNEGQAAFRQDPVPPAEIDKSGVVTKLDQIESNHKWPSKEDQEALAFEGVPAHPNMASHSNDLPKTPFRLPPPSSDVEPPPPNSHPTPGLPANTPMAIQVLSGLLALGKSESYNQMNENKQYRRGETYPEMKNAKNPARDRPIVKKSQRDVALAAATKAVNFVPRPQASDVSIKGKSCNCKRSQCLKLYCECFAAGGFCLPSCSCLNCSNTEADAATVESHRQLILTRNPFAFDEKITGEAHKKGCRCKRSKCLKKYCECYNGGVRCNPEICQCEGCRNLDGENDEVPASKSTLPVPQFGQGTEMQGAGKVLLETAQNVVPSSFSAPRDDRPVAGKRPLGAHNSINQALPMHRISHNLLNVRQSQIKGLKPQGSNAVDTVFSRTAPAPVASNPVAANAALLALLSQPRYQGMDTTMGLMQMMLAINRMSQIVPQQAPQNALADILPLKLPTLNTSTSTAFQTPPIVTNRADDAAVDGALAVSAHVSYDDSGLKRMAETGRARVLTSVDNIKQIEPRFGQRNCPGDTASMSQKLTMTGALAAASKKGVGMSRHNPQNRNPCFEVNENIRTTLQDQCDGQDADAREDIAAEKRRPKRAASGGVQGAVAAITSDWGLGIMSPPHKRNLASAQEGVPRRSEGIRSLPRGL